MADQNFVSDRCYAQWTYNKGWRKWRDRIIRGHIKHRCVTSHAPYGTCKCRCGARLRSIFKPR